MKKVLSIVFMAALLTACGETGDKALKAAAKAVLEEDNAQNSEQQSAHESAQQDLIEQELQDAPEFERGSVADIDSEPLGQLPPKPAAPQNSERVVRHRATVLTQYGGRVLVRQAPSRGGRQLGYLYDQEEVWVVGETNRCETINGLYGCWVKVVDVTGLTGYSFGAYLNY
ncbi:hypothetical protein B0181_01430 [Moraxella caviae]|uniref:SH3b domain-containing protein n=1 Tax=Moraxella caviae TaxID=34060 RepID=A0A1T0AAS1_9GAMM|nr:SH3 domain-containing protein [Moraxella caviae]OOR92822.1 hypothetical protein B0181_01430 [Moraxella caviae]STZ14139.1 Uncharacterised protein [Moraxella caviae]VEW10452.1 Uncharacterised protein [Moraxella caviae]